MSNESHFTGNQNIVIQNVTDSNIKIAIGDHTEEILLELAALKQLLAERNSQIIQIAGKIYNIGTETYLEAEVFFDANCHHYDFYKNGKLTYRSQITQQGINFYNNVIAQAKQGPPSQ